MGTNPLRNAFCLENSAKGATDIPSLVIPRNQQMLAVKQAGSVGSAPGLFCYRA